METLIGDQIKAFIVEHYGQDAQQILSYFPGSPIDCNAVQAVMINEVVADTPQDDFYSQRSNAYYMQTTLPLFQKAGVTVAGADEILGMGIYITSVVKMPKGDTVINTGTIQQYVPILEKELALFPSLKAIMLMGDVAKKAVNQIAKKETKKNVVPAVSTYKLRHSEIMYKNIRLFPAYIMTGKNLAIEKSKTEMSAEELTKMLQWIGYKK